LAFCDLWREFLLRYQCSFFCCSSFSITRMTIFYANFTIKGLELRIALPP
jgi:hypothetical protein